MKQRYGLSSIAQILQTEMDRRFSVFQDPGDCSFKPIYVIATFLDPRYRIILSDEQFKFAKLVISMKLEEHGATQVNIISLWHSIMSLFFIAFCRRCQ
jgi:hypothetical protein